MVINQSEFDGAIWGAPNKDATVKLVPYKEHQNHNALIMAEAGKGMNYSHKYTAISEHNKM